MKIWERAVNTGFVLTVLTLSELAQAAEVHDLTLQWNEVEFAEQYKLEEQKPGESEFTAVYTGPALTAKLTSRVQGSYRYRVVACLTEPVSTELLCNEIAEYSDELSLNIPIEDTADRNVIFIHTDLLGSPAAETDEQGNVL